MTEDDRATLIVCARAYLAEARRRRGTAFARALLAWAARCRREAAAWRPAQGRLL